MTDAEIRLKCVELCNRHDQKAEDIIAKAGILAMWVKGSKQMDSAEVEPRPSNSKAKGGRKSDNADIF